MQHFSEEGSLGIKRFLKLLVAKIHLPIACMLIGATVAVVIGYSLPKKYSAKATVYIEQSVVNDLVRGIAITPSMSAKIKVLKVTMLSRKMLLEVIRDLDMDLHSPKGPALEGLIKNVRSRVGISLNEGKGLFIISFTDSQPARARDFVNTLTRKYIESSTSSKREEAFEATRFLADQIEVFRKRIETAQDEIDEFKAKYGDVLTASEVTLRQENQLVDGKLQGIQIKKNELLTRRGLLMRNTPLRSRLELLEGQKAALLVSYTAKHPNVRRLQKEIEGVRREIANNGASERQAVYGTAEYQSIKVELDAVERAEKTLREKVDANEKLLKQIPGITTELNELMRKKKNETIIYERLVSRYGQSEVSKQMELQDKAVSFRIIDPAIKPSNPFSPNRVLIIFAGLILGLVAGVGSVLMMDFFDGRVKSYEDLLKLGLPVMAVIPDMDEMDSECGVLRTRWKLLLFTGLYLSGVIGLMVMESMHLPHVEQAIHMARRMISAFV